MVLLLQIHNTAIDQDEEYEEDIESGIAIDDAVLLSVLLLMVEVELSLEVVLVVIEELIFVSHLVELAKEAIDELHHHLQYLAIDNVFS
jgi:hypothetical protein